MFGNVVEHRMVDAFTEQRTPSRSVLCWIATVRSTAKHMLTRVCCEAKPAPDVEQ
jgi:hypothetical protein